MAIDSGYAVRQLEDNYEALQSRSDLDLHPLPPALVRGTPGSVLDPVVVHATVILGQAGPTPREQVAHLAEQLTERLPDLPPTEDPVLERLRAWRPERGGSHAD